MTPERHRIIQLLSYRVTTLRYCQFWRGVEQFQDELDAYQDASDYPLIVGEEDERCADCGARHWYADVPDWDFDRTGFGFAPSSEGLTQKEAIDAVREEIAGFLRLFAEKGLTPPVPGSANEGKLYD